MRTTVLDTLAIMNAWAVHFRMNLLPMSNIAVLPTILPLPRHMIEIYQAYPVLVCTGKPGNEARALIYQLLTVYTQHN